MQILCLRLFCALAHGDLGELLTGFLQTLAQDLGAAKAILKGLEARRFEKGVAPILIHTVHSIFPADRCYFTDQMVSQSGTGTLPIMRIDTRE
jgi:hypothetical protein